MRIYQKYYSGVAGDPEGSPASTRVRDAKGRYKGNGNGDKVRESRTLKLFKSLRNIFDNHFLVSFIKFIFNHILNKLIKAPSDPLWYKRTKDISTIVGRFFNWSIGLSLVMMAFRFLYDWILGLLGVVISSKKVERSTGPFSFLKGLWAGLPSQGQGPPPETGFFSRTPVLPTKEGKKSLWDKITSLWEGIYGPPIPSTLNWWPDSWVSRVFLLTIGSIIFYVLIRAGLRRLIRTLHDLFDWAAPSSIRTLQEEVEKHSSESLRKIRSLGNYLIVIDKSLEALKKDAGLAKEIQEVLQGITKDVAEFRELESQFLNFVCRVSARLDNLGEQANTMNDNLVSTMKILVGEYDQTTSMERGLIDDESFARSYRMAKVDKEKGLSIVNLASVRRILDPNSEVTREVGRIAQILQSENENLKDRREDSPFEREGGETSRRGEGTSWKGKGKEPSKGEFPD